MRHDESKKWYTRITDGVARSSDGDAPIIVKYAARSTLYDHDNNAYTDYALGGGSLLFGHGHRNIVLAAKKAAERCLAPEVLPREAGFLVDEIRGFFPACEQVHFTTSYVDALLAAIRLARYHTTRKMIVTFDACASTRVLAGSEGCEVCGFNDVAGFEKIIAEKKEMIAAVVIEPVATGYGIIVPQDAFFSAIRARVHQSGIFLICDEVMTAFRGTPAGAYLEYQLSPDITVLGGIMGGGLPLYACGANRKVLAPVVSAALRFSGRDISPVLFKTALAALRVLSADVYGNLDDKVRQIGEELNQFFTSRSIAAHAVAFHSMMSIRFSREPIARYDTAWFVPAQKQYADMWAFLLERGIYFPTQYSSPFFISAVHSKRECAALVTGIMDFFEGKRASKI